MIVGRTSGYSSFDALQEGHIYYSRSIDKREIERVSERGGIPEKSSIRGNKTGNDVNNLEREAVIRKKETECCQRGQGNQEKQMTDS